MAQKGPKESKFIRHLIQLEIEKHGSGMVDIDHLTSIVLNRLREEVSEIQELADKCIFYYLRTRVNAQLRARRGSDRRVTVQVNPGEKLSGWVNVKVSDATPEQLLHKTERYESVIKGAQHEIARIEEEFEPKDSAYDAAYDPGDFNPGGPAHEEPEDPCPF